MAIVKAVSSKASIGKAIKYVTKPEKTEEKLVSGIECSPQTAIQEMMATKEMWGKTEGRQYKHYVQSFKPDEDITPEKAHELAKELCKDRFKGHEVLIATHTDRDTIHSHIIVNSVNYENGYKLNRSKHDLAKMKEYSDELCKANGLSVTVKGENSLRAYDMKKYKVIEKDLMGQGKSYVYQCFKAVDEVKDKAVSREDFIAKMKEKGYETNWSDTRKHVTFQDKEGNKVRNSNLEKTFDKPLGKGDLEHGFERNVERTSTERRAKEQLERAKELNRGTGTDDRNSVIDNLNATIRDAKDAVSLDDSERNDRITQEQSVKREQDRAREQKAIERSTEGFDFER